jgi:hypothetical protein
MPDASETADRTIRIWLTTAGSACIVLGVQMIVLSTNITLGLLLLAISGALY